MFCKAFELSFCYAALSCYNLLINLSFFLFLPFAHHHFLLLSFFSVNAGSNIDHFASHKKLLRYVFLSMVSKTWFSQTYYVKKLQAFVLKKQKKKKEKTKLEAKKVLQLLKRSLKKWEFMNLSISVIPAVEDADMSTGKLKLLWIRLKETNYWGDIKLLYCFFLIR